MGSRAIHSLKLSRFPWSYHKQKDTASFAGAVENSKWRKKQVTCLESQVYNLKSLVSQQKLPSCFFSPRVPLYYRHWLIWSLTRILDSLKYIYLANHISVKCIIPNQTKRQFNSISLARADHRMVSKRSRRNWSSREIITEKFLARKVP